MGAGLDVESAHRHCRKKQCRLVAGFLEQASSDPIAGWGALEERTAYELFERWELHPDRKPRPGFVDEDDSAVEPDLGLRLAVPGLSEPTSGGLLDVYIDVKAQAKDGSAKEKLEHTIRSYAALSDTTGSVCLIAHLTCPVEIGAGFLSLMGSLAERELVGFVELATLTPAALVAEVRRLALRRQALLPQQTLRETVTALGVENLAAALRLALREQREAVDPQPESLLTRLAGLGA